MPSGKVNRDHIHLLQSFGRHPMQREMTDEQREQLWTFACNTARLPSVTYKDAVETWKALLVGDHHSSRIAVTPTGDPLYITVAICLESQCLAAHTGRADAMIASILAIYANPFSSSEQDKFLDEVKLIATAAWKKNKARSKDAPS